MNQSKKRILITAPHLIAMAGGELLTLRFLEHFSKKYDVELVTERWDQDKTFKEFKDFSSQIKVIGKPTNIISRLSQWMNLDCLSFDVVIAGGFPSYFCSFKHPNVVEKFMIIPAYVQNPFLKPLQFLDSFILSKCRLRIVDTKSMQEKVLQTYNLSSTVVAPGIDLKKYRPKKAKNYFLHVSRLDPEKGVLDLINAWDISTPLYLAGSGKEDYVSFLKEKAKGKKITFLGNVDPDSLRVYFAESLGVLLAAYNEPFGIVVIEGMASGKPVIALNKGGPADLIKPDFGFLVHNHGEMVSKASWIVSHQSKAAVMGKKAQKAVRAFDIEFYLSEIERLVLKD